MKFAPRRLILHLFLVVLFATSPAPADEPAADKQSAIEGTVLLERLRQGGHVIYLRHAQTDQSQVDTDRQHFDDCSTQRNLSEAGKAQAGAIGKAFESLGIPTGTVLSSPYCRAKDTARLAFGKLEVTHDLRFAIGADKTESVRLSEALKHMLRTAPSSGTNTVLVGHTANLKEATGIWPKPEGVAVVFEPGTDAGFVYVGQVRSDEWATLARGR